MIAVDLTIGLDPAGSWLGLSPLVELDDVVLVLVELCHHRLHLSTAQAATITLKLHRCKTQDVSGRSQ